VINGDGGQTRDFVTVEATPPPTILALNRAAATAATNLATATGTRGTPTAGPCRPPPASTVPPGTAPPRPAGRRGSCLDPAAAGSTVPPVHGPARPGEQRRSCLDPALAGRRLGWRPSVTLRDGLAATYEFFKKETTR